MRAAIFDLDGTIADSEPLHREAFNAVLARFGLAFNAEQWARLYAGTGTRLVIEDQLVKRGLLREADTEELGREVSERYATLARERLVPTRGFTRFFDELRRRGVPCIIASNGAKPNVRFTVELLKLDLPFLVAPPGRRKPDPAVYELALERLGVSHDKAVVFEDSVPGVVAAKRAGCYCVALLTTRNREELEEAGANLVAEDFTRLDVDSLFGS